MNINLPNYANKLALAISSKDESALEQILFDLEYSQLENDVWPQSVFIFFIDAIQDESFCQMRSSSKLVSSIYNDFEKLTDAQQYYLLNVMDDNADQFLEEMLRHSVGDLVARKYPSDIAIRMFEKWKKDASKARTHMALVGFHVLLLTRKLSQSEDIKVRQHLKQLSQS